MVGFNAVLLACYGILGKEGLDYSVCPAVKFTLENMREIWKVGMGIPLPESVDKALKRFKMNISSKLVNEILKSSGRVNEALMEKAEGVSRKLFHSKWEEHFNDVQEWMMNKQISLNTPIDKIVKQFKDK